MKKNRLTKRDLDGGKMKEVTSGFGQLTILKVGEEKSGSYVQSREGKGRFGKQIYYDFESGKGDMFTLPGSYDLDRKMARIPEGTFCSVKLDAQQKVKGRKQKMKVYKIDVPEGTELKKAGEGAPF